MHRRAIKPTGVCHYRAPTTNWTNFCDFNEDSQWGKTAVHAEKKQFKLKRGEGKRKGEKLAVMGVFYISLITQHPQSTQ